jgi:hypothetical protein
VRRISIYYQGDETRTVFCKSKKAKSKKAKRKSKKGELKSSFNSNLDQKQFIVRDSGEQGSITEMPGGASMRPNLVHYEPSSTSGIYSRGDCWKDAHGKD